MLVINNKKSKFLVKRTLTKVDFVWSIKKIKKIKFLGNMSNPSINRWGLNLFWYRFWYNDTNNSLVIHQDNLINKLILLYMHYGLLYPQNMFINKYWYFTYKIKHNILHDNFNIKYFRLVEYKNRIVNEYKSYKIRTKIKNLYFSKIWILRYQNWLIVNFYCFQPLKSKTTKKITVNKTLDFYLNNKIQNKNTIHRYKMYLFYFLNNFLTKSLYYKF